tara:strand:- start:83 stop:238 length:156 start_codon:yes stop_codon:yes gene_type:complete
MGNIELVKDILREAIETQNWDKVEEALSILSVEEGEDTFPPDDEWDEEDKW